MTEHSEIPSRQEQNFTNRVVKIFLESNLSIILILLAAVVGLVETIVLDTSAAGDAAADAAPDDEVDAEGLAGGLCGGGARASLPRPPDWKNCMEGTSPGLLWQMPWYWQN